MSLRLLALLALGAIACGDDGRPPAVDADMPDTSGDAGPCEGRCEGDFPFCVEETNECVACLGEEGCEAGLLCEGGSCVSPPCTAPNECTDPAAAHCDIDEGRCGACQEDDHCAHLDMICVEGTCEMPPPNPTCMACTADDECGSNARCIFMRFAGDLLDQAYCARLAPEGTAPCEEGPFLHRLRGRANAAGTFVGDFCTLDESVTTCAAYNDAKAGKACEASADCGEGERLDSRCIDEVCTHRCRQTTQCDDGLTCWDGEGTAEDDPPPPPTQLYCGSE